MARKIKSWRSQVRNFSGDELLWWQKTLEKEFHANGDFRTRAQRRMLEAVEAEMSGE